MILKVIESPALPEEAGVDWSLLEVEGVREVAEDVAWKVVNQYGKSVEFADMLQEAYLAIATHPRQMRRALAEHGFGRLHHAVWCDVTNVAAKATRRKARDTSYEGVVEGYNLDRV